MTDMVDVPSFEHAVVSVDTRGACTLEIRGAKSLNILNSDILVGATEAARWLGNQAAARAVVIRGSGERAFIAGADIREMASLRSPEDARAFITRVRDFCEAIREIPVPTIARIPGHCLGAGLEVAAACDIRLGSDNATFGMPEVKVGIPSVVHAALLPKIIGLGATNWMLLTGDSVDAEQALRWGFLQFKVPAEKLDALVERTVDSIVANGPRSIRTQKVLNRFWEESGLVEGMDLSVQKFGESFSDPEPTSYLSRFAQRSR